MLDERNLFDGESREAIKRGAEGAALSVMEKLEIRCKDMGNLDRKKATITVLGEAIANAYGEGRTSCMIDGRTALLNQAAATLVANSTQMFAGAAKGIEDGVKMQITFIRSLKPISILLGGSVLLQIVNLLVMLLR